LESFLSAKARIGLSSY